MLSVYEITTIIVIVIYSVLLTTIKNDYQDRS